MSKTQMRKLRKACDHSGERRLLWQAFSNGKVHLRADCNTCGGNVSYVPKSPENVAGAFLQHHEGIGCTWGDGPRPQAESACGHKGQREFRWHLFQNGRLHLSSACGKCGHHIGYAVQTSENVQEALAQRRPPINCTWDEVLARQPHAGPETVEIIDF